MWIFIIILAIIVFTVVSHFAQKWEKEMEEEERIQKQKEEQARKNAQRMQNVIDISREMSNNPRFIELIDYVSAIIDNESDNFKSVEIDLFSIVVSMQPIDQWARARHIKIYYHRYNIENLTEYDRSALALLILSKSKHLTYHRSTGEETMDLLDFIDEPSFCYYTTTLHKKARNLPIKGSQGKRRKTKLFPY